MREAKIRIGIVGGSGYAGVELLRLLARHPSAEVVCATSREADGRAVADLFPWLRGHADLHFTAPDAGELRECDAVFCATANGVAMQYAPKLLEAGVKVIDLSADFRLKDVKVWEHWYAMPHACPQLLSQAVYGLPEMNREAIRTADLVANPGCYPTAVTLGFLPLLEQKLVDPQSLIADAKSGVSGAGRGGGLGTAFAEVGESFKAYGASGHRHLPEIAQQLSLAAAREIELVFTPHLLPIIRGIHATLYAKLKDPAIDVQQIYAARYADEAFVDVLPPDSHPDTRGVRGANVCRLAVHRPPRGDSVVVLAVEDNLVKGAAGQAMQNLNLMFGFDETTALDAAALAP